MPRHADEIAAQRSPAYGVLLCLLPVLITITGDEHGRADRNVLYASGPLSAFFLGSLP